MTESKPHKIYCEALNKWGAEAQTLMVFEEMSELQKELCKHARGKDNRELLPRSRGRSNHVGTNDDSSRL